MTIQEFMEHPLVWTIVAIYALAQLSKSGFFKLFAGLSRRAQNPPKKKPAPGPFDQKRNTLARRVGGALSDSQDRLPKKPNENAGAKNLGDVTAK